MLEKASGDAVGREGFNRRHGRKKGEISGLLCDVSRHPRM